MSVHGQGVDLCGARMKPCRFLASAPRDGMQRTLSCSARASCFWRLCAGPRGSYRGQMPARSWPTHVARRGRAGCLRGAAQLQLWQSRARARMRAALDSAAAAAESVRLVRRARVKKVVVSLVPGLVAEARKPRDTRTRRCQHHFCEGPSKVRAGTQSAPGRPPPRASLLCGASHAGYRIAAAVRSYRGLAMPSQAYS